MMRLFVKDGQYYGIDVGQEHLTPEGAIETTQAERDALPENVKARHNTSVQAQINALEAQIQPLVRQFVVRPNAPMARPSGPPKTPAQVITDIDSQIEALKATLIP